MSCDQWSCTSLEKKSCIWYITKKRGSTEVRKKVQKMKGTVLVEVNLNKTETKSWSSFLLQSSSNHQIAGWSLSTDYSIFQSTSPPQPSIWFYINFLICHWSYKQNFKHSIQCYQISVVPVFGQVTAVHKIIQVKSPWASANCTSCTTKQRG